MNRWLNRLWNAMLLRIRRWLGEDANTPPSVARPGELDSLRREAGSLCALASQARLAMAETLRKFEEADARIKTLLREDQEAEARRALAELAELEADLVRLTAEHAARRRAAEEAVAMYRRGESLWKAAQDSERRIRLREPSAWNEARTPPPNRPEPAADLSPTGASDSAALAAREALRQPPLSAPISERTPP